MTIVQQDPTLSLLAADLREPEPANTVAFTTAELEAMNRYCLKFRDLVRGGGTPTKQQEDSFMQYQAICYQEGAAHE